jgi:predicted transposase YdaD
VTDHFKQEGNDVTQDRRESLGRWIGSVLTVRDLMQLIILIVTIVGGYFTLTTRITILETQRSEDRQKYKEEVVTREVLDERNKNILEKLDAIDKKLSPKPETLYEAPNFTYVPGYKTKKH